MSERHEMVEPGVGNADSPDDELLQIRRAGQQLKIVIRRGPVFQIDGDNIARFRPRHLAEKLFDPGGQGFLVRRSRVRCRVAQQIVASDQTAKTNKDLIDCIERIPRGADACFAELTFG